MWAVVFKYRKKWIVNFCECILFHELTSTTTLLTPLASYCFFSDGIMICMFFALVIMMSVSVAQWQNKLHKIWRYAQELICLLACFIGLLLTDEKGKRRCFFYFIIYITTTAGIYYLIFLYIGIQQLNTFAHVIRFTFPTSAVATTAVLQQ